jgi:hypothetical protein
LEVASLTTEWNRLKALPQISTAMAAAIPLPVGANGAAIRQSIIDTAIRTRILAAIARDNEWYRIKTAVAAADLNVVYEYMVRTLIYGSGLLARPAPNTPAATQATSVVQSLKARLNPSSFVDPFRVAIAVAGESITYGPETKENPKKEDPITRTMEQVSHNSFTYIC